MKCPSKCRWRKGKEMKSGGFKLLEDGRLREIYVPFTWVTTEKIYGCRFINKSGKQSKDCPKVMKFRIQYLEHVHLPAITGLSMEHIEQVLHKHNTNKVLLKQGDGHA